MINPFRPQIGMQTIGRGVDSTHANFARSVRTQMQGIIKEYSRFVEHVDNESVEVLRDALQPTFNRSQELVPVQTGNLKESGFLETESFRGRAAVAMGYGKGNNPDYAAIVHEDPDKYHEPPTQYKYLQQPLEEDIDFIGRRIFLGFKRASGLEMG